MYPISNKGTRIALRCLAVVLFLLAFLFGATLGDYCLGDQVFQALGWPAWSRGTQGWHYPAIIALVVLLVSFLLIAFTTQKPLQTLRYLLLGLLLVGGVLLFFSLILPF